MQKPNFNYKVFFIILQTRKKKPTPNFDGIEPPALKAQKLFLNEWCSIQKLNHFSHDKHMLQLNNHKLIYGLLFNIFQERCTLIQK